MADETIRFDDGASDEIMMGRWSLLVGERLLDRDRRPAIRLAAGRAFDGSDWPAR